MNVKILKFILLMGLIFQLGCNITFKRKTPDNIHVPAEMKKTDAKPDEKPLTKKQKVNNDTGVIAAYYADEANKIIREDIISHTEVSKKQAKKLVIGKIIPRDIQVIPLPLNLEKILSSLPLQLIRVQVGERVIIMDVKSRRIIDIIKI